MRLWLLLFTNCFLQAQNSYPDDYFMAPLDIPLILAGNFGELRADHFHSGIDIKTQRREGLNVYAAAAGYVSRIKVSGRGYGKVIYITHPNGFTTVYAHLQKFDDILQDYVIKKQYEREEFEIELFPKPGELPVSKGDIIGYSGNTGSSSAAHLHFEIRHSATQKVINPFLFGLTVPDSRAPLIQSIYLYPLGDSAQVNRSSDPLLLSLKPNKKGQLVADTVKAHGSIGVGINTYDRQDGANNKNGTYSVHMTVNNKDVYAFKMDDFSFAESSYINNHIDYKRFCEQQQRIQKCFVEPSNRLRIYSTDLKGVVDIKDSLQYIFKITASDYAGNKTMALIPVEGNYYSVPVKKDTLSAPYHIDWRRKKKITEDKIRVYFPKYSFYKNVAFNFYKKDSIIQLHDECVPLHKKFTLTVDISDYSNEDRKQLFIGRIDRKGKVIYQKTTKKENFFTVKSKYLGRYVLLRDNEAPEIEPLNFKNGKPISNYDVLKLKITDALSGINYYRGTIDGKWVLFEYDPKNDLISCDLSYFKSNNKEHTLTLEVTDMLFNTATYTARFLGK